MEFHITSDIGDYTVIYNESAEVVQIIDEFDDEGILIHRRMLKAILDQIEGFK